MRRLFLLFFLLTGGAVPLLAQVSMELQLNRSIYMINEPVAAKIKLRNYSGQHLVFGHNEKLRGELLFEITGPDRTIIPLKSNSTVPITGMVLRSGETKEVTVVMSRYYPLARTGVYRVHAYIRHNMLKGMFKSNDVRFDIFRGTEVWRRAAGMPEMLKTADAANIRERSYVLKALPDGDKVFYYLQVEDRKNIYALFRLGRQVGVERYRADVDMLSRLHLLLPLSPKIFRYNMIDMTGSVEVDRYLKSTDTIPSLYRNPENGQIIVVGGAEAVPGVDYKAAQPRQK